MTTMILKLVSFLVASIRMLVTFRWALKQANAVKKEFKGLEISIKRRPSNTRFGKRQIWRSLSCKERMDIKKKCDFKGFREYQKHLPIPK